MVNLVCCVIEPSQPPDEGGIDAAASSRAERAAEKRRQREAKGEQRFLCCVVGPSPQEQRAERKQRRGGKRRMERYEAEQAAGELVLQNDERDEQTVDSHVRSLGKKVLSEDQEIARALKEGALFRLKGAGNGDMNGYYKVDKANTSSGKIRFRKLHDERTKPVRVIYGKDGGHFNFNAPDSVTTYGEYWAVCAGGWVGGRPGLDDDIKMHSIGVYYSNTTVEAGGEQVRAVVVGRAGHASCLVPRASCLVPRASCLVPRAAAVLFTHTQRSARPARHVGGVRDGSQGTAVARLGARSQRRESGPRD
eukprot:SAG22_NODE_791_length_7210_cov_40.904936_4_plen_307_part_00